MPKNKAGDDTRLAGGMNDLTGSARPRKVKIGDHKMIIRERSEHF